MRVRWSLLQALFLAGGTHAADIGGYFHEVHKRESQAECASWIAAAQKAPPPDLLYRVGLCYSNGWGVPEDRVAAEAWLRSAAERGQVDAQVSLGDTWCASTTSAKRTAGMRLPPRVTIPALNPARSARATDRCRGPATPSNRERSPGASCRRTELQSQRQREEKNCNRSALLALALLGLPPPRRRRSARRKNWKGCKGKPWVIGDSMDTPLGDKWWPNKLWGAGDEAGATNWYTKPEVVQRALGEAKQGKVYRLGAPYTGNQPAFGGRQFVHAHLGTPTGGPFGANGSSTTTSSSPPRSDRPARSSTGSATSASRSTAPATRTRCATTTASPRPRSATPTG